MTPAGAWFNFHRGRNSSEPPRPHDEPWRLGHDLGGHAIWDFHHLSSEGGEGGDVCPASDFFYFFVTRDVIASMQAGARALHACIDAPCIHTRLACSDVVSISLADANVHRNLPEFICGLARGE